MYPVPEDPNRLLQAGEDVVAASETDAETALPPRQSGSEAVAHVNPASRCRGSDTRADAEPHPDVAAQDGILVLIPGSAVVDPTSVADSKIRLP